jgi:4-hydroxy-tetrahydrodipicolinate synthase
VAGAGAQSTDKTIELARFCVDAGCDGLLIVTPYYNKPQPDGLVAHFTRVAQAVGAPIMLYNVPGRTGVNMRPETVARLSSVKNIVAIKEASGDVNQSSEILARCGDRFTVLAGDDALTLPILAVGGRGTVSVAGNLVPDRLGALIRSALSGDYASARRQHLELYDLCQVLFVETSPAPAKYAMQAIGMPVGPVRLPLSEVREDSRRKIDGVLEACGLLRRAHA